MSADLREDVHAAIRGYVQAGKRGLDLAAAMECAVDDALASRVAQTAASDEIVDSHLDAVLKASGSALRHFSLQKTKDDMRAAMRRAMGANL